MHRAEVGEGPRQGESGGGRPKDGGEELPEAKDVISAVPSSGWRGGSLVDRIPLCVLSLPFGTW